MKYLTLIICLALASLVIAQPQIDLSGIEINVDQDGFVDWLRDKPEGQENPFYDDNYNIALRIGIYGNYANSYYLGLPWVREKIDGFLIDNLLYSSDFRRKNESHNFVFTVNGFGPTHISDEVEEYAEAVTDGYSLFNDRPFSSFTGFRSTRRLEGTKRFVHSAKLYDMGVNTSFVFGIGGIGLSRSVDNLFGRKRPKANLWKRDENKPYPTGQVLKNIFPLFLYSLSTEVAVWKPIKKFVIQVRPEINLGYYTDFAFGIDLGKVMSVERVIDHMAYTDTNNPSSIHVNDEDFGFSLVGGATARAVLYNYHLNGLYGKSKGHYYTFADTRKLVYEAYVGMKIQILQTVEFSYALNWRTSEFKSPFKQSNLWGTIGVKYLMGPAGVGCYD